MFLLIFEFFIFYSRNTRLLYGLLVAEHGMHIISVVWHYSHPSHAMGVTKEQI